MELHKKILGCCVDDAEARQALLQQTGMKGEIESKDLHLRDITTNIGIPRN